MLGELVADRGNVAHHSQNRIADYAGTATQRAGLGQVAAELDYLLGDRMPFCVIAVKQRLSALATNGRFEFPGEVERVLHPGVHALPTSWAVDVGRVAGQKHPAMPVGGDLAVVNLKAGQPVALGDRDAADTFVEDSLQVFLGWMHVEWRAWRVMDLGHQPRSTAPHRHRDHRALGREDGVHRFPVEIVLGVAIAQNEPLALERALQLGPDQVPGRAVGAVGGDDPGVSHARQSRRGAVGSVSRRRHPGSIRRVPRRDRR